MSYQVLARKYRPRSFTEMVGQEHVVQALSNALTQQRLHHAYLFTGTRGVGKTTVSRILAKSLNCTGSDGLGGITASPCGQCAACQDIDAGRFVDYVELDAASNRGVEEISQLLDQSVYKPVVGRFKVYMIDEVHMLSTTAFNAMLKTLEEPPDYLKFVLATTDPQKVPVTVLSRCLQFNLRPMAPVTVLEHLQHVLRQEAIPAELGALRLLSRAARGSMRDALSLADQAIAFGAGTLGEAGVRQMLGSVDRGHVLRIVEAVVAADGAALVAAADALRVEGLSAAGALEDLAQVAQQMAVLQAVPDAGDADDPDLPALLALAAQLPADETQLMYSIALHGRSELGLAPDEYAGLTMALLRLLAFRPQRGQGERVPNGEDAGGRRVAAPPAVATIAANVPAARRDLLRPARSSLSVPAPEAPDRPPADSARAAIASLAAARQGRAASATPVVATPSPLADAPPWDDIPPADADAPPAPPLVLDPVSPARALAVEAIAVRPTSEASVPASAVAGFDADPRNDGWVEMVRKLLAAGAIGALTRELAVQAHCVGYQPAADPTEASRWTLRVERESLRQAGHVEKLVRAIGEVLGQNVALDLEAGAVTDSVARRDAHAKARTQALAEEAFRTDDRVVSLLARYPSARIVPESVRPA